MVVVIVVVVVVVVVGGEVDEQSRLIEDCCCCCCSKGCLEQVEYDIGGEYIRNIYNIKWLEAVEVRVVVKVVVVVGENRLVVVVVC